MDVCLLVEGSYPYVSGGVATWVQQLISSMKELSFGVCSISAHSDPLRKAKYDLPSNVVYFQDLFLHDYQFQKKKLREVSENDFEILESVLLDFSIHNYSNFSKLLPLFQGEEACFSSKSFFESEKVWKLLLSYYQKYAAHISFLDFFWTWRNVYLPVLQILQSPFPQASIFHAVSTGYAGLMGVVAKILCGGKYFLTEHGIYTHERRLEIAQADWIADDEPKRPRASREVSFFKSWWTQFFQQLSHLAYEHADQVFTLYEGNKLRQVLEGCPQEKVVVIPNGIELSEKFEKIKAHDEIVVALVGRVVEIKDVKTFIRAASLVLQQRQRIKFLVIGPQEEEKQYVEECLVLVDELKVGGAIQFLGYQEMNKIYPELDILVLTSLSESQPYVILEAGLQSIPVIATDVGACREMLEGSSLARDKGLGKSGLITSVSSPEKTALAILKLAENKDLRLQMGQVGQKRVELFYNQSDLLSKYLNFYEQNF